MEEFSFLKSFLNKNNFTVDECSVILSLPDDMINEYNNLKDNEEELLCKIKTILHSDINNGKREECWPDCVFNENIVVNDVSQLNATRINGLYQVRTIEDIQNIIKKSNGRKIIARGTKHSMGGHSIANNGIVIDMQYIKHMSISENKNQVTVGSGATWGDLIQYLNRFGKAPRTLQSYCSFSIGGTLSVNGHGITTDYTVSESVISFRLIKANGEIINCARDSENKESQELFSLCLGGYGLFGIIYDVTLKIDNNYRLSMDTVTLSINEFANIYESLIDNQNIVMKLARIDTTTFNTIDLFVFRKECDSPTISNLGIKPKEMGNISSLIYKWIAAPFREVRFAIEHNLGVALDWGNVTDRNEMLFESATPLAKLYSPLVRSDDTFILQEYFIPKQNFLVFMRNISSIILEQVNKDKLITLLNITIRFVKKDNDTVLSYASSEEGMFAFVFYYRIRRTNEADEKLRLYHDKLVDITLSENGTFYLPYRHHFTDEQLHQAYPNFKKFSSLKEKYDSCNIFNNLWWNRYGNKTNQNKIITDSIDLSSLQDKTFEIPKVSIHRDNSFKELMHNNELRRQFRDGFLTEIFNIKSPKMVWGLINSAIWKERNGLDNDIYNTLLQLFSEKNTVISQFTELFSQLSQLSSQKEELVREIVSIVARLGLMGKIQNYCSIGDHGKLILPLREKLNMHGNCYIVHDKNGDDEDIPAILERGEIYGSDVGQFEYIDYNNIKGQGKEFIHIENESCDMVTMNQGLHHLPPHLINNFLQAVHRILKPGGIFIVREHDLDEEKVLLPMLDCAHMVFNAGTGVPLSEEKNEIRGFRSALEWRKIIENQGFEDSMIYEIQPFDPTIDIMMCFFKLPRSSENEIILSNKYKDESLTKTTFVQVNEKFQKKAPSTYKMFDKLPQYALVLGMESICSITKNIEKVQEWINSLLNRMLPEVISDILSKKLKLIFESVTLMLNRMIPIIENSNPLSGNESSSVIPKDLYLLYSALQIRANKGNVIESIILKKIGNFLELFNNLQQDNTNSNIKPVLSKEISLEEVNIEFEGLRKLYPQLNDINTTMATMGLPNAITNIVLNNISSIDSIKKWLVDNMDRNSWKEFTVACSKIKKSEELLHIDIILIEGTGWNLLVKSMLGCRNVKFTGKHLTMLKWFSLGKIGEMWTEAQKKREKLDETSVQLSDDSKNIIDNICPVTTTIGTKDINNVLSIISAELISNSATKLVNPKITNITEDILKLYDPDTNILHVSKYTIPSIQQSISLGWSNFRLGSSEIKIKYRKMPKNKFEEKISKVITSLVNDGLVDGSLSAKNGPLTWYKLPEWLQVEISELFGNSMRHTPWYRFPFMKVFSEYGTVLMKEFQIVSDLYDSETALFNPGFLTDVVPMIVMGILFAQLALLAYPLGVIFGDSYDKLAVVEQLILTAPSNTNWNDKEFKDTICSVNEIASSIWVIRVKTFIPFSDFIISLANKVKSATILEISNQKLVQIKVETTNENQQLFLEECELCDVKFKFQLPTIGEVKNNLQISLGVKVHNLLSLIRKCKLNNIKVVQVYDFYC